MSQYSRLPPLFVTKQLQTQRQNLATVCRLAVKTLVDKSSLGITDDACPDLENFMTILEHIFNHRLKPYSTWYGGQEPRCFWDYIRIACQHVPHSCLASIEALEMPQTPAGKGRAWIRMCLMEKRLADYVSVAVQSSRLAETYYDEDSMMLSDDISMLPDLLLGLNSLDFSFDLRSIYLDYPATPAIDFTPYLKFDQSTSSVAAPPENVGELDSEQLGVEFWKTKYDQLEKHCKVINEQKNYVEELLRVRESQLTEVHTQHTRVSQSLQLTDAERKQERAELEAVVMELQAQLAQTKDETHLLKQKLRALLRQKEPTLSMSELMKAENNAASNNDGVFVEQLVTSQLLPDNTANVVVAGSSTSTYEGLELTAASVHDDRSSTTALAGSFVSNAAAAAVADLAPAAVAIEKTTSADDVES